jgi:predicted HTH domain antitoxin
MSITLDIPEDILAGSFGVPTNQLPRCIVLELACALYGRDAITLAQAGELAGLDRFAMAEELGRRNIPRNYTAADVAADLAYASR